MPEVAHAGEDHGNAMLVGSGDDFGVAHRATGLDDRSGAGGDGGEKTIGEGIEGLGSNRRALVSGSERPSAFAASSAFSAAMRAESTRLIWPAPMPAVWPFFA